VSTCVAGEKHLKNCKEGGESELVVFDNRGNVDPSLSDDNTTRLACTVCYRYLSCKSEALANGMEGAVETVPIIRHHVEGDSGPIVRR
jgi:hypothetical protein